VNNKPMRKRAASNYPKELPMAHIADRPIITNPIGHKLGEIFDINFTLAGSYDTVHTLESALPRTLIDQHTALVRADRQAHPDRNYYSAVASGWQNVLSDANTPKSFHRDIRNLLNKLDDHIALLTQRETLVSELQTIADESLKGRNDYSGREAAGAAQCVQQIAADLRRLPGLPPIKVAEMRKEITAISSLDRDTISSKFTELDAKAIDYTQTAAYRSGGGFARGAA
jgi:hypothetical protein